MSAIILFGCSASPVVPIPEPPGPPEEWGDLATNPLGESDCPDVQGTYLNLPKIVTVDKEGKTPSKGNDFAFYSLFPVYLATDGVPPPKPEIHEPVDSLTLQQPSPNELILTVAAHDRAERFTYHFFQEEGDFECSQGFIKFPISNTYGMGEGTLLNGQDREKISLIDYRDLTVISTWGPYRSRKSNVSAEFTHEFYLYERLKVAQMADKQRKKGVCNQ